MLLLVLKLHLTSHFHPALNFTLLADLFYSGEAVQFDQPQSFTCPFCGKLGLKEIQLHEHVTREHLTSSAEVVSIFYVQIWDRFD